MSLSIEACMTRDQPPLGRDRRCYRHIKPGITVAFMVFFVIIFIKTVALALV